MPHKPIYSKKQPSPQQQSKMVDSFLIIELRSCCLKASILHAQIRGHIKWIDLPFTFTPVIDLRWNGEREGIWTYEGLDDFIFMVIIFMHFVLITNQKHYNFLEKVSNIRTFQTWICFDYINGPSRAKSRALKIQQGLNETATLSLSCVQTLKSYGVIAFFHHCATLVTRTTGYNRTWKKQPPMCAHT